VIGLRSAVDTKEVTREDVQDVVETAAARFQRDPTDVE
jgi:cell division ATPase FtsA